MSHLSLLPSVAQLRAADKGIGVLSRRRFLLYSGAGLLSLALLKGRNAWAAPLSLNGSEEEKFHQLCQFLTVKELNASLTVRALAAFSKVDAGFGAQAASLGAFVQREGFSDIEALKNAPQFTGELKKTALTIISGLYLGYAGTPQASAEDNTQFITYTQALMYRQTYDHTPIPSYSRWSTGYWEHL